MCVAAGVGNQAVLEASLSPANGAPVSAGTAVTFVGHSGSTPTFAVASSPALLSSPDIDSGPGSAQPQPSGPPLYTFISTKATATPGTVYWDVSFSDATLTGCEGMTPTIYTTPPRTLTVLPSPPTTTTSTTPPATIGSVSFEGSAIAVQGSGDAAVKLACTGTGACAGKLSLTVRSTTKKGRRSKTVAIGLAPFSIPAGESESVTIHLNARGRALLSTGHGRLTARLQIEQTSGDTQTRTVHLIQRASHSHKQRRK